MSIELIFKLFATLLDDLPHVPIFFAGKEATARPVDEANLLAYALLDRFEEVFSHAQIGKARTTGWIELDLVRIVC